MRRAVAGLLLVALAACSNDSETPRQRGVVPRDGEAAHLRLDRPRAPQLATLTFTIDSGTCSGEARPHLGSVDVRETTQAVTVTAKVVVPEKARGDGGFCAGVGISIPVAVTLKAPLGNRRVLDGSCSPPDDVIEVEESREPCTPTDLELAQKEAVGTWTAFDTGPLAPRSEPKGVWTGERVIVVGGLDTPRYGSFADGASYDPKTDRWERIAPRPDPGRILGVAWTGTELFALGNIEGYEFERPQSVHLYNPKTNRWRAATVPRLFSSPTVLATGRDVIVWDQFGGSIFDPQVSAWTEIPKMQIRGGSVGPFAKWITGTRELSVQGGFDPMNGDPGNAALFLFKPSTRRWRRAADSPVKLGHQNFSYAAAVGDEEVLATSVGQTVAYDAARDKWRKLPSFARAHEVAFGTSVDIGDNRGIVITGNATEPFQIIDLEAGRWSHAASPGPLPAGDGVLVWTGEELVWWGGPIMWDADARNRAWKWRP